MHRLLALAVAAGTLAFGSGALATTYTITVPGSVTAVTGAGPISVGDQITLKTTVDDSMVVNWAPADTWSPHL